MKKEKGFSLIELCIVIFILLVLAAIAIPALIQSRERANESSALGSLRTLLTAETAYQTTYQTYSPNLVSLGSTDIPGCVPAPTGACIVDGLLSTDPAQKSGYTITYTVSSDGTDYFIVADPSSTYAGTNHYCSTSQNVILFDPVACTASSSSIP